MKIEAGRIRDFKIGSPAALRDLYDAWINNHGKFPAHVSILPYDPKTDAQNNQQHEWYREAERQKPEMTAADYRAECKAHCGLPILFRDSEEYREAWDRLIRDRYDYEEKLELMKPPVDYPVTRAMNKKQLSEFLDAVFHRLTVKHGIDLSQYSQDKEKENA